MAFKDVSAPSLDVCKGLVERTNLEAIVHVRGFLEPTSSFEPIRLARVWGASDPTDIVHLIELHPLLPLRLGQRLQAIIVDKDRRCSALPGICLHCFLKREDGWGSAGWQDESIVPNERRKHQKYEDKIHQGRKREAAGHFCLERGNSAKTRVVEGVSLWMQHGQQQDALTLFPLGSPCRRAFLS